MCSVVRPNPQAVRFSSRTPHRHRSVRKRRPVASRGELRTHDEGRGVGGGGVRGSVPVEEEKARGIACHQYKIKTVLSESIPTRNRHDSTLVVSQQHDYHDHQPQQQQQQQQQQEKRQQQQHTDPSWQNTETKTGIIGR